MPEPKRDRWGRYLIRPATGGEPVAHTRVTTVAKALDDGENIARWKQRHVAKGLSMRADLLALAAATPLDEKGSLDNTCSDAIEAAAASSRANLGTALHKFLERLDRGESMDIPEPWLSDTRAYRWCLTTNKIEVSPEWTEVIAVCDVLPEPVAGTIDRIVGWKGRNYIADVKTGSDLKWAWRAIAVQLAIYSRSETLYDPATETHSRMPTVDQDRGIVFHLPAGTGRCVPYMVDLNAGWDGARRAVWVRQWRKRDDLAVGLTG
jgi:hypothetical protein